MAAPFRDAQIVILGEVHDNPVHHTNQAQIAEALQPDALVFEMIEPAAARRVTPRHRTSQDLLPYMLEWDDSGWPDFALYFPIFAAAPDAAIYGAALPRDEVRRAVKDGAAPVFGDAAALFGLDQPLPDDQLTARLQLQQDAHCGALPEDMLPGMVEAQRLRDAALAKATVAAFEHARATSDTPQVVVITGNGHARDDWGMPVMLRHYYADDQTVEIATLAQFESSAPDAQPYTSWLITEAAERPDPCDTFK